MISYLLFALIICVNVGGQETEVDSLLDGITQFINSTTTYQSPVNNAYEDNTYPLMAGTYDFIIIGAGSAGCVLANRLSGIPHWRILLLEAGGPESEVSNVPGVINFLRMSEYNWGYNTTSQKFIQKGYINNSVPIPRGRALGGSSAINAMIYSRGNRKDFDRWGARNPGWDYESVLPYFMRSERSSLNQSDVQYHGHSGPLNVEETRVFSNLSQAFLDANVELGRRVLDYNGMDQMGFGVVQTNEINGSRDSGGRAFLEPALHRPNLKVQTNTLVTKILISRRRAYAVEYTHGGNQYYAFVRREVIVSAGSLNTPQILMLSGIGPAEELRKHNIKLIRDLPVGKNLWDHLIMDTQSFTTNYTFENLTLREQVEEYLKAEGPLTSPDALQAMGYVNLLNQDDPDVPDIEHVFHFGVNPVYNYSYYRNAFRSTPAMYQTIIKPTYQIPTWQIHSVLLHPRSRGQVTLKSNSPNDFPVVDPRYFTDPLGIDLATLVAAIRDMMRIANTTSLGRHTVGILRVVLPQCEMFAYGSDGFWRCQVKNLARTGHHFGGTAKMGPRDDPTSVVDNHLRVHGMENLRVVDCSVIPSTLSGHTNAPAYMIAEKASDLITHHHIF